MPDPHLPFHSPLPGLAVATPEPTPSGFSLSRMVESGGSIRLVLAGELDLAQRTHFENALGDAQVDSDRVLLDLGALTLIDCANLFVVFAAGERSRREETALILLKPRGQVRRVLGVVGTPAGVATLDHDDLPDHGSRVAG